MRENEPLYYWGHFYFCCLFQLVLILNRYKLNDIYEFFQERLHYLESVNCPFVPGSLSWTMWVHLYKTEAIKSKHNGKCQTASSRRVSKFPGQVPGSCKLPRNWASAWETKPSRQGSWNLTTAITWNSIIPSSPHTIFLGLQQLASPPGKQQHLTLYLAAP